MTRWTRIVCLVALLPACADSCGCGNGADPSAEAAASKPQVAAGASASSSDAPQGRSPEPDLSPQVLAMRNQLAPNEDEDERQKLERAAAKIDTTSDLGEPIPADRFQRALPDRIGDYRAEDAAQVGQAPAEVGAATTAARRYRTGASIMNVKVTDTADAPGVRRELAGQLAMVGNAPTGHQRGRMKGVIPGVLAYHEEVRASRAMALINGRFLVEVMVEQADEEDAAWSAVEAIDVKALKR